MKMNPTSIVNQGFSNKIDLARGDMVYMEEIILSEIIICSMKTGLTQFWTNYFKANQEWVDVFSAIETEIVLPLAIILNIMI